MKSKYVNPFTDFGFKKIFGEEASKPILIDFLNSLLPDSAIIKDLSFKNSEKLAATADERKAIFDIYCENEIGEKFIVELQKAKQNYFKERTIYYSAFPIIEQSEKGDWDFDLKAVFCIGILDFTFNDGAKEGDINQVKKTIQLKDDECNVFYEKLTYIYLEMPKFKKQEHELSSRLDKWLYFIKYLEDFQAIPQIFKDEVVFMAAFEKAEIARYNQNEMAVYHDSLKVYRDLRNVIDTARMEGEAKGRAEGNAEGEAIGDTKGEKRTAIKAAKVMKESNIDTDIIKRATGLTEDEINEL